MSAAPAPVYVVVMAGGSGTRFWPLSRAARPKQFLPLGGGDESLLAATTRRTAGIAPPERTLIVTSEALAEGTRAAVPQVPAANVLAEPVGRNTAAAVGWAAAFVARRDPSALLAVLPADHHIADEPGYAALLGRALEAARGGDLVTVGIRPTRPETGYGYIETGDEISPGVCRARRFVEKPDEARAREFLAAGRFLWNSGMFFFRADALLAAVAEHLPELAAALRTFDEAALRGEEAEAVAAGYAALPSVSIDNGIMEKAARVAVLPGDFGWSDVGSWTTAWELSAKDEAGNGLAGEVVTVDAGGCYVRAAAGKVVALVGVEDLVVVDTEDALLVMPRDRAQDVRRVIESLKASGRSRWL